MGREILLTLERYCYSMHLIHFRENSMVAPDLPPSVQEGSVQHGGGGMGKVRPLPGSPACYDCLWVACLLGCLNRCFNKCCRDARIRDVMNTMYAPSNVLTLHSLLPHLQLAKPFPNPCGVSLIPQ